MTGVLDNEGIDKGEMGDGVDKVDDVVEVDKVGIANGNGTTDTVLTAGWAESRREFGDGDARSVLADPCVGVTKIVFAESGSLTITVDTIVMIDGGRVAVIVSVASGTWVTVLVSVSAAAEANEGELPSTATTE